ncbi:MAG: fumarate hydratase C-terminal domain-containing protein [Candidatus Omnitrophica bacterium]|nr:fumarate hydratase C-terminal domain-containing protein [Candidatus Omnitrophota bacterium]
MNKLTLPLKKEEIRALKAGQSVLLSGIVYTARDAAHKILAELIKNRKKPPVSLKNITIYYAGPAPSPRNQVIGSCGPTTSARMDIFTPALLRSGVKAMIGKGRRSKEVKDSIIKYKAVYFLAPAGCGALLSKKITKKKMVAYKNLGPEAIYELEVKDFPVIVGIDSKGGDIFKKRRRPR